MNPTIKGVIADVVQTGGLTLPIARQLTTDPDRNRALILNIAFRVACQLGSTVNPTDLLAQVGVSLSHTVTTLLSSDTDKKSRKIPGIEMLWSGDELVIDFGLGFYWQMGLHGYHIGGIGSGILAAANILHGLDIALPDKRWLMDAIMPVVVQENNGYTIQRITSAGDTEDLYRSDQRSYRLSDITTPRTTRWWDYPVYSKEDFALYLETVINSEIPEAEKNAFVDALLRTSNFDENIIYDRPPYAGGSYSQREKGIRITLPTGASMRIDATSNQLKADSDRQTYYIQESDVVFIMALVERGRLPPEALNSVYRVTISETNVSLSESLLRRGLSIDMTQPFDKTINFSPLYLSLLLTRDPRISESDRQRLRQYFGNNINLEVRKKSPHNVA